MASAVLLTGTLILVAAFTQSKRSSYSLQEDISKKTLKDITASTDYSQEQQDLLKGFTGVKADKCKDQLGKQNFSAALQSKLVQVLSKIEYIDKTYHASLQACSGEQKCEELAKSDAQRDLSVLQEKAETAIASLKQDILQKEKDFMEKCVQ